MKPAAYKYPSGFLIKFSTSYPEDIDDTKIQPLYAIDFSKYALVPREPTKEMQAAGFINGTPFSGSRGLKPAYKAMIEAAPKIEDIEL
jgi:hypothetical protein